MRSKTQRSGKDGQADLFSVGSKRSVVQREPLAERMRPHTFAQFAGQEHLIGEGRLLRRAVEADRLGSIILHGPPGTGKTTIANIIANETKARFVTLNAVLDGVKELREVVDAAEKQFSDEKTLLFVDYVQKSEVVQSRRMDHLYRNPHFH